jgi:hypothetical protein
MEQKKKKIPGDNHEVIGATIQLFYKNTELVEWEHFETYLVNVDIK